MCTFNLGLCLKIHSAHPWLETCPTLGKIAMNYTAILTRWKEEELCVELALLQLCVPWFNHINGLTLKTLHMNKMDFHGISSILYWLSYLLLVVFRFVTLDINAFQRKDIIFQEALHIAKMTKKKALFSICNTWAVTAPIHLVLGGGSAGQGETTDVNKQWQKAVVSVSHL